MYSNKVMYKNSTYKVNYVCVQICIVTYTVNSTNMLPFPNTSLSSQCLILLLPFIAKSLNEVSLQFHSLPPFFRPAPLGFHPTAPMQATCSRPSVTPPSLWLWSLLSPLGTSPIVLLTPSLIHEKLLSLVFFSYSFSFSLSPFLDSYPLPNM